jgi:hypothetical protein
MMSSIEFLLLPATGWARAMFEWMRVQTAIFPGRAIVGPPIGSALVQAMPRADKVRLMARAATR